MKQLYIKIVLIIQILGTLIMIFGCNNTARILTLTPTSYTPGINTASTKSGNNLLLSLTLDAAAYQTGQKVKIVADEKNLLSKKNNVIVSNKWPLDGLILGPCDNPDYPFRIGVFQGYYLTSNLSTVVPLNLYDPNIVYSCLPIIAPKGYLFQPLSNIANLTKLNYQITLNGYWPNGSLSKLTSFEPGVYTVVAGDEWGALVVLHFTVTQ